MSILDGLPTDAAEYRAAMEKVIPRMAQGLEEIGLTKAQRGVLELMSEGLSLADIKGVTKEERDALLAHGLQFLRVGDIAKARDVLIGLYQIEPMDERVIYALGASYQAEGDLARAGKLYVHFLALDATNPEGHLRLGECFLANGEIESAIESFEIARALLAKGKGDPASTGHAEKMLGLARERQGA